MGDAIPETKEFRDKSNITWIYSIHVLIKTYWSERSKTTVILIHLVLVHAFFQSDTQFLSVVLAHFSRTISLLFVVSLLFHIFTSGE